MAKYIKIIAFSFLIALIGSYWIVCDVSNNTVKFLQILNLLLTNPRIKMNSIKLFSTIKMIL